MSNANHQLALNMDVPAYIRAVAEKEAAKNKDAMGGIKAGSFPRLSIGGSKFSIVEGGEKVLLVDPNDPRGELPLMRLGVVVVGFNPGVSKLFYPGEFEEGSDKEPTCSSDDGITPDAHITAKQAAGCAACPQNVWGSKVSKQGKQIKACSDNKRLAVIMEGDFGNEQALDLTIKPSSLKTWAEYVRALDAKGIPVNAVVTHITFDPSATFPKLAFRFGRYLTEQEMAVIDQRAKGDDVRLIISPRKSTSTGAVIPVQPIPVAPATPAPAPAPVAPAAPVAPVAPAPVQPQAPTPAPAPVQPTVQFDPYAGLPVHVKQACEAVGGLGSETGKATYKALAGKDVPVPPAPAAPAPVDPYAGLGAHVKQACEAVGGLGSDAGKMTYKALTGKDAPAVAAAPAAAPAAPKATRTRKASTPSQPPAAPASPAPVAQAPAPAPAAPAGPSMATPPAGAVAGSALGNELDALLAGALATPVAK